MERVLLAGGSTLVDPHSGPRFYALEEGGIVGYAVFGCNGRVSHPWCLPGAETWREPLLETALAAMRERGLAVAWAAYRADRSPVLDFFHQHEFAPTRRMINYVADVSRLPVRTQLPQDRVIEPLKPEELPQLLELAPALFPARDAAAIARFYRDHPVHDFSQSLVALKDAGSGEIRGVGLLVLDDRFADPTKIDAAMPCFRLGAWDRERAAQAGQRPVLGRLHHRERRRLAPLVAGRDASQPGRRDSDRGPGSLRSSWPV
jgi:hypothetical protein